MFEKKITQKQVHEIADKLRDELTAEIEKTIAERQELEWKTTEKPYDSMKVQSLYSYQHALEHSRMNMNTLVHRIDIAINYK